MINIERHKDGITIKGHAGYARPGHDIVCAAVSVLLQCFIASVEELTADELQSDMTAGNAVVRYGNLSESAQILIDSFFVGVRMIADTYPNNVKLTEH